MKRIIISCDDNDDSCDINVDTENDDNSNDNCDAHDVDGNAENNDNDGKWKVEGGDVAEARRRGLYHTSGLDLLLLNWTQLI